jgi:hypothetical protein
MNSKLINKKYLVISEYSFVDHEKYENENSACSIKINCFDQIWK